MKRDQDVIDPDPNHLYTRRKERQSTSGVPTESQQRVKFPSGGWGVSLEKMPLFTRAEMNSHVMESGKTIGNKDHHSVPTGLRKAKTFLVDEYLQDIQAANDQRYFFFQAKCCHSFRKNDPPHTLKVALCIASGDVANAWCSCVAGNVGYCNHVLALMLKMCKYTLYDCKSTKDLCQDGDENPALACTSELQKWHNKGGRKNIVPQPVMEVNKTKLDESRTRPGVRSPCMRQGLIPSTIQRKNRNSSQSSRNFVQIWV